MRHSWDSLLNGPQLWVNGECSQLDGELLGGPWWDVLLAHLTVSSHRLVPHAAADGGRRTGLRGFCDHSCIPLLLSGVVCETVTFEE